MVKHAIASGFFICLVLVACGTEQENYLEGSLTENYDFDFDSVRVRLFTSELSIEYVSNAQGYETIPARVTINVVNGLPSKQNEYDLAAVGDISRGSGFTTDLPDIVSGQIQFDEFSENTGDLVEGSFQAVFPMTDSSQKTLRGGFSASLEVVNQ